ncbi:MAG TPA: response regulator transcription factor [Polyangiaceae bacterium]|nr:response regulator transcription factor [Polyangiaceae bacterium]
MGDGSVKFAETRAPRVLLVGLDGGIGRTALQTDHELTLSVVDTFERAQRELSRFDPDAIVIAFSDPPFEHVAELKRIRAAASMPILVISRPVGEQRVTELIKAGASGYLFAADAPRLPDAIRELLRGGVPMSEPVSRLVLGRARRSSAKMAAVRPQTAMAERLLTERQREILKHLANGHSYDDIGLALNLSVNTVRSHVRTIYERLGASTKVEAVVAAIELRLIDREPFR